jgi:hypothetical protein
MKNATRALAAAAIGLVLTTDIGSVAARCYTYSCGGNTPILYGNPIHAVSTAGAPNREGVVLRPGGVTLRRAGRADVPVECDGGGFTLRVVDGALVAGKPKRKVVCGGAALLGATFELEVSYKASRVTATISIDDATDVSTWERDDKRRRVLPAYRLSVVDNAIASLAATGAPEAMAAGSPLCETRTWMEHWQLDGLRPVNVGGPSAVELRYANPEGVGGRAQWLDAADQALMVAGMAFDETGSVVARGDEWVSIACPGSALAKLRLLGLDPAKPEVPVEAFPATLKMLGARLDGANATTVDGTPLRWDRADGVSYFGGPLEPVGPVEARWGPAGATCLSHHRRFAKPPRSSGLAPHTVASIEEFLVGMIRGHLALSDCGAAPPGFWETRTVAHVFHRLVVTPPPVPLPTPRPR